MRFSVLRLQLNGSLEIRDGLLRIAQIIEHVSTVYISSGHLWVPLEGSAEITQCFLELPRPCMNITFYKCEVLVVGKKRLVFDRQIKSFFIAPQIIKVICQVDWGLRIVRQLHKHF